MKVVFAGLALRIAWMAAALVFGLGSGLWAPKAYVAALLTAYLAAQIVEGFRYRSFVDNR